MRKTYRLQWDRDLHGEGERAERLRFRRDGSEWCEVSSIDELPDDIRQAFERARGLSESFPEDAAGPGETVSSTQSFFTEHRQARSRRRGRRRPTRAREIDRTLCLDYQWFHGLTLVCIIIAAPYMAYLSLQEINGPGATAWAAGALLALSAVLTYYGLCLLVNSTEFRVDDEWLTVKHGPLPWFGARRIPSDRVVQLSTRMHRSRYAVTFSVTATMIGHPPVQLAEGINTYAEAHSIERAIERHLGIPDE